MARPVEQVHAGRRSFRKCVHGELVGGCIAACAAAAAAAVLSALIEVCDAHADAQQIGEADDLQAVALFIHRLDLEQEEQREGGREREMRVRNEKSFDSSVLLRWSCD